MHAREIDNHHGVQSDDQCVWIIGHEGRASPHTQLHGHYRPTLLEHGDLEGREGRERHLV